MTDEHERIRHRLMFGECDRVAAQGEAVIPHLVLAIRDEQGLVRRGAVDAFVKLGAPSIPALLDALKDGDWNVRDRAARALERIGDKNEIDLRAVQKTLEEFVGSVNGSGIEIWKAKREAAGHYAKIARSATYLKSKAGHGGILLEGGFPKPPRGMYRKARAFA